MRYKQGLWVNAQFFFIDLQNLSSVIATSNLKRVEEPNKTWYQTNIYRLSLGDLWFMLLEKHVSLLGGELVRCLLTDAHTVGGGNWHLAIWRAFDYFMSFRDSPHVAFITRESMNIAHAWRRIRPSFDGTIKRPVRETPCSPVNGGLLANSLQGVWTGGEGEWGEGGSPHIQSTHVTHVFLVITIQLINTSFIRLST